MYLSFREHKCSVPLSRVSKKSWWIVKIIQSSVIIFPLILHVLGKEHLKLCCCSASQFIPQTISAMLDLRQEHFMSVKIPDPLFHQLWLTGHSLCNIEPDSCFHIFLHIKHWTNWVGTWCVCVHWGPFSLRKSKLALIKLTRWSHSKQCFPSANPTGSDTAERGEKMRGIKGDSLGLRNTAKKRIRSDENRLC